MFYVHKNNGQEIKEKVSFSDDSLIRDSLSSNYTLSIYKQKQPFVEMFAIALPFCLSLPNSP